MTATTSTKPWTDTPLALIPTPNYLTKKNDMFTNGASHMCMVHNSIYRGYNSIYQQAPHIIDADKPAFIGYCLTWHKFVKTHADNEDNTLFSKIEELLNDKTIFEKAHEEHELFYPGLAEFHKYLTNLPSTTDFSAEKLLEIMISFQSPFNLHMISEINTIAALSSHPNALVEGSPEAQAAEATMDARERNALTNSGMTDVLPFFLFNFDSEYEDGMWKDWPPIPGLVRWMMMKSATVMHPGWWKFASCDSGRKRKGLYAVPPTEAS